MGVKSERESGGGGVCVCVTEVGGKAMQNGTPRQKPKQKN